MSTTDFDDELLAEIQNLRSEIDILRMAMLDMEQRNAELEAINTVAAAMNRSLELQEVVDVALESTLTALKLESGLLCLFDPSSRTFMPAADREIADEIIVALASFELGSGAAGLVGEMRAPLIIPDLSADSQYEFAAAVNSGLPFFAGIPIAADDDLLGVMILLDAKPGRISADWIVPLGRIGDLVGRAMANAQVLRRSKQEIVERMMGDQQLRRLMARNQEKLRLVGGILDALPFAVIVVDTEGENLLSNRTADEVMEDVIEVDEEGVVTAVGGLTLPELRSARYQGRTNTVGSHGRDFLVRAHLISSGSSQPVDSDPCLLVIHESGDELAEKMQDSSAAAADQHTTAEVMDPLATMLGVIELYATIALRSKQLPDEICSRLSTIEAEARRASSMVRKIIDSGEHAILARRPVDLAPLIDDLEARLGGEAPAGVTVSCSRENIDLCVNADPVAIVRILDNLIANSCEAMPEGGELSITASETVNENRDDSWQPPLPPGRWIEIIIGDTGHGIPEEILPRVFDLLFTTRKGDAERGLGLNQARGLVHQHGGHIGLRSLPGKSCTVAVHLPALVAPAAKTAAESAPEMERGSGESVMVIESDPLTRAGLARAVEELGYRAMEAESTPEAMTVFQRYTGRLAVVLVEELEEADAQSLLHELTRQYPLARAVLMTRHEVDPVALQQQGWNDWMPKPPQLWELSVVLARAVNKA